MQSGRLLRVATRSAARYYAPRRVGCLPPQVHGLPRRPYCADAAAAPKPPPPPAQRTGAAKSAEAITADAAKSAEGGKVADGSKAADSAKIADAVAPTAAATEQSAAKIPDVSSTSLGLEDPMTNDPLKWKKFAWKYAGAVLLFFVSYKTLHWYVDRLEADGKRRREEVEENKSLIQEMNGTQQPQGADGIPGIPVASAVVANQTVEASSGNSATPLGPQSVLQQGAEEPLQQMRIFDPVKEEEPHLVSELDELYVYKIELETKLRDLGELERTGEIDAEKLEIETELKSLAEDIVDLEAIKTKS